MALVAYSDSETSDTEDTASAPANSNASNPSSTSARAALRDTLPQPINAATNPSQARKLKFELPSIQPDPTANGEDLSEPPAKKARTGGTFSGFNSLLPAPKRPAVQNASAPRAGVSLRTSNEAAFSRSSAPRVDGGDGEGDNGGGNEGPMGDGVIGSGVVNGGAREGDAVEVKAVGKATRFKPLSVTGKKKGGVKKGKDGEDTKAIPAGTLRNDETIEVEQAVLEQPEAPPPEKAKPKRSLFAISEPDDETETPAPTTSSTYESIISLPQPTPEAELTTNSTAKSTANTSDSTSAASNPLNDLNLTPAQQRRLFGRHAKDPSTINITHFNTDAEYAANEQLRQAGEVVEHRAVKTIAPGKHSLQQLVNNARSQQEGLEDKWAAGRKERGEGASRYGWGR